MVHAQTPFVRVCTFVINLCFKYRKHQWKLNMDFHIHTYMYVDLPHTTHFENCYVFACCQRLKCGCEGLRARLLVHCVLKTEILSNARQYDVMGKHKRGGTCLMNNLETLFVIYILSKDRTPGCSKGSVNKARSSVDEAD